MTPLIATLLSVLFQTCAAHTPDFDHDWLTAWRAGEEVSVEQVEAVGLDSCFSSVAIPPAVRQRMEGVSWKDGCPVPWEQLRYLRLLHLTADGRTCLGEMVCHSEVAAALVAIFKELYRNAYPIERMVLIDDYGASDDESMRHNNTSCFNYRKIAGKTRLSVHSWGRAVDINPLYNPYVRSNPDGSLLVLPSTATAWADRSVPSPYRIDPDDLCCRLFRKYGFAWGGGWKSLKDYHHFEKPTAP